MNKLINYVAMGSLVLTSGCATSTGTNDGNDKIIDRPAINVTDGKLTPEILESFVRVTDPQLSPDKTKILYSVSYSSIEENKSNAELCIMNIDGSENTQITKTSKSESNATWIEDGKKIAFLYDGQLWTMNIDGTERNQISKIEGGMQGFILSPDKNKIVYIKSVKTVNSSSDIYTDLPKATGKIVDDLMYKHWDEWVKDAPHPFVADFDGDKITNDVDILKGEPYEAPMKPFGGIESLAWCNSGKSIIYVCRKKTGKEYALSTNSDLYMYTIADKTTKNLTEGMMGYDTYPKVSPDGTKLAWLSMEHDGYESDKNRVFILDFANNTKTDLTADWDYTSDAIEWNIDSKSIYMLCPKDGVVPIYSVNIDTKQITEIARDTCDYASILSLDANKLLALRHSLKSPNEIYAIDVNSHKATQLSNENTELLSKIKFGKLESRYIATTDGKQMLVNVLYPPNFDPNKKYPSILYCQGGPQGQIGQSWSYRWNFATMAAQGYIVIMPHRRGMPGFGTEWNAQISGDYTGQNMKDYLSAADDMLKEPFIDNKAMACVGASYGGYSVYWLAGNHNKRFCAFIAHAGIFNMEAQYLETEEMWFANWDMGGAYWQKDNATAQRTFNSSPHKFIDKWDTPILVTCGELDYRILASQGMMAFNAAKLRGIPTEMLIFPDENHWILKPQNAQLWQRVFFRWLDKWCKSVDFKENVISSDSIK